MELFNKTVSITLNEFLLNDLIKIIVEYYGLYTLSEEYRDASEPLKHLVREDFVIDFINKNQSNLKCANVVNNIMDNKYLTIKNVEEMTEYFATESNFVRFTYVNTENSFIGNIILHLKINKLLSLEDIIRSVQIEIGGSHIDKIYGLVFDTLYTFASLKWRVTKNNDMYHYEIPLPFDFCVNKKAIASLKHHDILLDIEFMKQAKDINIVEVKVKYNILESMSKKNMPKSLQVPIVQLQYTGSDEIVLAQTKGKTSCSIGLRFNLWIYMLFFVFTDANGKVIEENIVSDIDLILNKFLCYSGYKPKVADKLPGKYFIPLSKNGLDTYFSSDLSDLINFTRNSVRLQINFRKSLDSKTFVHVFALNANCIQYDIGSGMGYLRWSN